MKEFTIQDLFKIVPISREYREELLANYESYNEDKKFEITRTLWEGFDELYDAIKIVKADDIMKEISDGKREATEDLNKLVELETEAELEKRLYNVPEDDEALTSVRDRLQQILHEK